MFGVMCCATIHAQQEPNFTMYNFNLNIINPAYVSVQKYSEASISYRSQWTGVPNAPNTSILSYVSPINDRLGFGVSVVNDEIFILNKTDLSLDLAYKVGITDDTYIHFGLIGTTSFVNLNLAKAGAPDKDTNFAEKVSYVAPAFGVGIYVLHPKYFVSLSTPNASKVKQYRLEDGSPDIVVNYLHLYLGAGYIMNLNRNVTITPALITRLVNGVRPSFDLSTTVDFREKIKGGFNYRWQESASAYTMFSSEKNFKFGFSYTMNVTDIAKVTGNGSLELLLKYSWD